VSKIGGKTKNMSAASYSDQELKTLREGVKLLGFSGTKIKQRWPEMFRNRSVDALYQKLKSMAAANDLDGVTLPLKKIPAMTLGGNTLSLLTFTGNHHPPTSQGDFNQSVLHYMQKYPAKRKAEHITPVIAEQIEEDADFALEVAYEDEVEALSSPQHVFKKATSSGNTYFW
jgi:hypothetical protein